MKQKKSTPEKEKEKLSTSSSKNYKIIPTDIFIGEAKELKKKYPNIRDDFFQLQKELKKDPRIGVNLGGNLYKVRMAIGDKSRGKSGGARVIVWVKVIDKKAYLLAVYDKAEKDTVIIKVMKHRIKELGIDTKSF